MNLVEQILALLYHFLMGQVFALLFSFLSLLTMSFKAWSRTFFYLIFSLNFTFFFYMGLFYINGGMLHFYLFVVFFGSLCLYYRFFYMLLLPLFIYVKRLFRPVRKKLQFAKMKICGIIILLKGKIRRLKRKNEQRENSEKETQKDQLSFEKSSSA